MFDFKSFDEEQARQAKRMRRLEELVQEAPEHVAGLQAAQAWLQSIFDVRMGLSQDATVAIPGKVKNALIEVTPLHLDRLLGKCEPGEMKVPGLLTLCEFLKEQK